MNRYNLKAINDYYLGLLYGDGYLQDNYYFFSTTRKEIADSLEVKLKDKDIQFTRYQREHHGNDKVKWDTLEVFEIRDHAFLEFLRLKKIFSENAYDRIKCNSLFVRGYLETKGTLFYYKQRNSDAWRIAFSGKKDDLEILHEYLKNIHGINCNQIIQRKEREDLNITSLSYRFPIQSRKSVAKFNEWIKSEYDISSTLKSKIEAFENWNTSKPFNMVKQYKHYRNATLFMAKHMQIELKGMRGGSRKSHIKPVFLWENGKQIQEFEGWKGAYIWAKDKFVEEYGLNPPIVAE